MWHTSSANQPSSISSAAAVGGLFIQSIFGRGSSNTNSNNSTSTSSPSPPTPSILQLVDTTKDSINNGLAYPELQICPRKADPSEETVTASHDNNSNNKKMKKNNTTGHLMLQQNSAMSFQLDIPLHHIQRIESIDSTFVAIYTKDRNTNIINNDDDERKNTVREKEAVRISFGSSDDRDTASVDLKILLEWNKHRRQITEGGDDDDDDDDEEMAGIGGIRQRAQKATHFAKREIEMREKKRDREQRKAGHMQSMSSGGLKVRCVCFFEEKKVILIGPY